MSGDVSASGALVCGGVGRCDSAAADFVPVVRSLQSRAA
jgi:hypothetical protein